MSIEYLTVEHLSTKDLIRIFSKISIEPAVSFNGTPCWIWKAFCQKGYGILSWHSWNYKIHRFIFAWLVHPLPKDQSQGELDHLCRRTSCCNPLHQEFVSTATNIRRSNAPAEINFRKTHCHRGHLLPPSRKCVECRSVSSKIKNQQMSNTQRSKKNAYLRQWRSENKERLKIKNREYREANKQRFKTARTQNRLNNLAIHKIKEANYRKVNRDKINQRQQQWRLDHPEEYKESNRRNNAKRYP